jgi:phage-related protein
MSRSILPDTRSEPLSTSNAQISYQKDIKKQTAHLRQALHHADEEAALVFRSLPTITDTSSHMNKSTKAIAREADELVHHLSNTLSRWRRTSSLAAETFAELLAEV